MKILYFAKIRDIVGVADEEWNNLDNATSVKDVLNILISRGEPWSSALGDQSLLLAVNQEVVSVDSGIKIGDELAIMPPVTGG